MNKFAITYPTYDGEIDLMSFNKYKVTTKAWNTGEPLEYISFSPLLFDTIEEAQLFRKTNDISLINIKESYDFMEDNTRWKIRVVEEEELKRYQIC